MFYINEKIRCREMETYQLAYSKEMFTLETNLGKKF